jgi:hypothetical protein
MASWFSMILSSLKDENLEADIGSGKSEPEDLRNCTWITELNSTYPPCTARL